jgi:signal transduction histidine kinase
LNNSVLSGEKGLKPPLNASQAATHGHWGVLLIVADSVPPDHSMNILRMICLEIARFSEMYELIMYERNMVVCLSQTHSVSMNALKVSSISELFDVWRHSEIISRFFEGMALWLYKENESLGRLPDYCSDNVKNFSIHKYSREILRHDHSEFYEIGVGECYSVILCPLSNGTKQIGVMGLFKAYRRRLRSEERAAALMISKQVAYNIENIMLNKILDKHLKELNYEKEFKEKIFFSINSGIIVVDTAGRVMTANPYAIKKLGLSLDEIRDAEMNSVVPGLLEQAQDTQGEAIFKLANGREVSLGFGMSPLHGVDGLAGKIILFRDLTEIIHLRNELKRKEYFSTIGKMASWIAHEVRNPVFAIASIARILLKHAQETEQEKFVQSILRETTTLNLLVDDLLLYGKPLELKPEKVRLNEFILETIEGVKTYATENGSSVAFSEDIYGEVVISMDRERIKQVLYNLIKNAIEASAPHITIDISQSGEKVSISVIDNGKGIKQSDISEMFIPFFTTKKSGTGLGLPICRKIVEDHGGSITISSIPESGTKVIIELNAA